MLDRHRRLGEASQTVRTGIATQIRVPADRFAILPTSHHQREQVPIDPDPTTHAPAMTERHRAMLGVLSQAREIAEGIAAPAPVETTSDLAQGAH